VVALLLNEWTTHLQPDAEGRPVLLVLDDYHVITQRAIHETVLTLIERLPPQLRLVLTSRVDPPLRLAHLRVRAAILEIRAASLLFSGAEVAAFLTSTMGLALPAPTAALLAERTEGWVAALQLAALSLRHQPDPQAFLATFDGGHRHLLTYLVDEVLSRQPAVVQEFLLATAVLDRLCAELCAAVISAAPPNSAMAPPGAAAREAVLRAQALLEELNVANLFLIPLDAAGQWYRYHTLFAEALRHRLRQRDPGAERTYRRRASAWYEQAGYGPEAIQQALVAQDWDTAARLIEYCADDVRRRGELGTFDTWLSALPSALVRTRPGLGFWQAVRLVTNGQFSAGETVLTEVEQDLARATVATTATGPPPAAVDLLRGRTAALRALMDQLHHGNPTRTGALARAALAQLPPADLEWRALALVSLAAGTYIGDELDSAWQHYQAASALSDQASYYFLAFLARSRAGALLCDRGELRAAHAYGAAARQLAAAWGVLDLPSAGHLDWFESRLYYEANDLPGAEQLARRSLTLASQGRLIELEGYAHLTLCQIRLAQGDAAGALAALDLAVARLIPATAGDATDNAALRAALDAWRASIKLTQYEPEAGWPLVAPSDPLAGGLSLPLAHWIWRPAHLLPARVRLLVGDPSGALACLEPLCAQAAAGGAQALLIAALALEAIVLQTLGRRAAARAALLRALTLGAAEGYTRSILDAGPPVGVLLRTLAQELARTAGTNPAFLAYVYRLRDAAGQEPHTPPAWQRLDGGSQTGAAAAAEPAASPSLAPAPPSPPGALLTSRELAILRLLAAGCSNQEIADQLVIGVNTVKWYLRTIYDKLDSTNRTQAVARARAFGLLR
jgi:LuxR family maltose regulon positive regulatory protein